MLRTFIEEVHCSPTELAEEFWNMNALAQLICLHNLNTKFFTANEKGEAQMAEMSKKLDTCDEDYAKEIKHFVTKLYEYIVKE